MNRVGRSSNGRTIDSGSIYLGSNPSLPAIVMNGIEFNSQSKFEGTKSSIN